MGEKIMNEQRRKDFLKSEFDCQKGDVVIFKINHKTYKGTVIGYIPKGEAAGDYCPSVYNVPDERDRTNILKDKNSVLTSVETGKKKLPTYYNSYQILQIIENNPEEDAI